VSFVADKLNSIQLNTLRSPSRRLLAWSNSCRIRVHRPHLVWNQSFTCATSSRTSNYLTKQKCSPFCGERFPQEPRLTKFAPVLSRSWVAAVITPSRSLSSTPLAKCPLLFGSTVMEAPLATICGQRLHHRQHRRTFKNKWHLSKIMKTSALRSKLRKALVQS